MIDFRSEKIIPLLAFLKVKISTTTFLTKNIPRIIFLYHTNTQNYKRLPNNHILPSSPAEPTDMTTTTSKQHKSNNSKTRPRSQDQANLLHSTNSSSSPTVLEVSAKIFGWETKAEMKDYATIRYMFWRNFNIQLFTNSLYFWDSDPFINRF